MQHIFICQTRPESIRGLNSAIDPSVSLTHGWSSFSIALPTSSGLIFSASFSQNFFMISDSFLILYIFFCCQQLDIILVCSPTTFVCPQLCLSFPICRRRASYIINCWMSIGQVATTFGQMQFYIIWEQNFWHYMFPDMFWTVVIVYSSSHHAFGHISQLHPRKSFFANRKSSSCSPRLGRRQNKQFDDSHQNFWLLFPIDCND